MATKSATLQSTLTLNGKPFEAGLIRAAAMARTAAGKIASTGAAGFAAMGRGVRQALAGTASIVGGIAGKVAGSLGLLAGVVGTAVVAGVKNIADLGGELSDTSARTGMLVKDLVLLREQFRQGGLEAGTVTQYVRRMNEALMSSGQGSKEGLFKALKLDRAQLLAQGPVNALNAIIERVRALNNTASQQKALSEIFGGRQGIQLMTLVKDPSSGEAARKMVGSMAAVLAKNANDLDRVGDNFFGGIPIKIQQAFAGFTDGIMGGLLKVTDWVESADFTPVGKRLGAQLTWAWEILEGLIQNDKLGKFVGGSLRLAFMEAASFFAGAMSAAWRAVFSSENLLVVRNLFQAAGMMLAASLEAALVKVREALDFGGATGYRLSGQNKRDMAEADGKMAAGRMVLENTAGLAGDMAGVTGKRFLADLANIKALPIFASEMANLQRERDIMVSQAAKRSGVAGVDPIRAAGGIIPALTPTAAPRNTMFENGPGNLTRSASSSGAVSSSGEKSEGFSNRDVQRVISLLGGIKENTETEIE